MVTVGGDLSYRRFIFLFAFFLATGFFLIAFFLAVRFLVVRFLAVFFFTAFFLVGFFFTDFFFVLRFLVVFFLVDFFFAVLLDVALLLPTGPPLRSVERLAVVPWDCESRHSLISSSASLAQRKK